MSGTVEPTEMTVAEETTIDPDTITPTDDDKHDASDSEAILEDMKQLNLENGENKASPNQEEEEKDAATGTNSVEIAVKPTVIEDFLRNFLISNEMHESLDVFQREWYNKLQGNDEITSICKIPDIYIQKERLQSKVKYLQQNLDRMESITAKVKNTWDNLRKERDFHRMHHRRVLQEKNELIKQLKRLKKYCDCYEPTINSLKTKYENAKKEKMLFRIDRDKMAVKLDAMEEQIKNIQENYNLTQNNNNNNSQKNSHQNSSSLLYRQQQTQRKSSRQSANIKLNETSSSGTFPTFSTMNPYLNKNNNNNDGSADIDIVNVEKFTLHKTLNDVHDHAISKIDLHPKKDIIATASDDMTWKLWNLPNGELIMSGQGHKDWISSLSFAPSGTHLATASGDCTIKIWDFAQSGCVATFDDHTSVIWAVKYHFESSNHIISCGMDHTIKLWDIERSKCRQTYRGHVDSVNSIDFQPYSNNIVSGSGDKTISFWDIRSALCIQTFYGHHNSINHVGFNKRCDEIISCDSDGIVKIFDIRMIKEKQTINTGKYVHPCSYVIFDQSGKRAIVACDDGLIKIYDLEKEENNANNHIQSLAGHQDNVNCIKFSHNNQMLISCSSDCTLRLWQ